MKVYRDRIENGNVISDGWFDIMECTYTGTDMGERKVVAEIKWATPIDFQIGDYIELQMQSLNTGVGMEGSIGFERFYIYTMPTVKKNARPMSSGEAFVHTVTFYPRQYELACVQMRDYIHQNANADTIIYTGFDSVSFVGGAHELMERIMSCLAESYHDDQNNPLWSYEMASSVNEDLNTSLERFPFSFSGNSVMDALVKLNDKEGINTTFFINGRKIYVGYRRPYFCRVTSGMAIDTNLQSQIFNFKYGKTSDKNVDINYGGLFNITKAVGNESPITKLYAYGASRNLNRYYCADRIKSGRYVNRLMLPSFDDDGRTDFVISEEGVAKYGIREASKQFENIYPSLRYMTYGDLQQVKYCIKVKACGLTAEAGADLSNHSIADHTYPIVRIQCYRVVESNTPGVNKLIEAAPEDDLAVMIHATGKVVKTILYGGGGGANNEYNAHVKQLSRDGKVPTTIDGDSSSWIPGACFAVHDNGFGGTPPSNDRSNWFISPHVWADYDAETQENINTHQISYADTFWLTDLYVMQYDANNRPLYDAQTYFNRDGYSAWSWPRVNQKYKGAVDSTLVNELVAVEPIAVEDTSWNVAEKTNQQYFDIYLRDVGFKIDEQNDFGEMVFIVDGTLKVSVLDGLLTGREFEVSGSVNDSQFSCVCAYNDDGTENEEFWTLPDSPRTSTGSQYARAARDAGAIWRIRLLRLNNNDQNYANLDIILPMKGLEMHAGDHVVFLDIFMPDVYIHAAENRLEREARKYLDANDKGTVQYSCEFDKVRIQQIPNYALQMREGLNVRLKDADLDITTSNGMRSLVNHAPNGLQSDVRMYTDDDTAYTETVVTCYNPENGGSGLAFYAYPDSGYRYLRLKKNIKTNAPLVGNDLVVSSFVVGVLNKYSKVNKYDIVKSAVCTFTLQDEQGGAYEYEADIRFDETSTLKRMLTDAKYDPVGGTQCVTVTMTANTRLYDVNGEPSTLHQGARFYCKTSEDFEFRRNKYYEVLIDVRETDCLDYLEDPSDAPTFALAAVPASDGYYYTPELSESTTVTQMGAKRRVKYCFYLGESFNEEYSYKPAILFVQDGYTETCSIRLISIVEKDYDTTAPVMDYVDLKVDNVTIKITDNTRPDDQRILKVYPQPIREIQANFKERGQASAWASLAQAVADNAMEATATSQIMESLINMARRNYRSLLALRNNIFDPDGNCDQVFLNTMMLQVGADSMNFRLEKTASKIGVTGGAPVTYLTNCELAEDEDTGVWYFKILGADTLYHYVYTQGAQGGTWRIVNAINRVPNQTDSDTVTLDADSSGDYPVYYICLKCGVDSTEGTWVVSTKQYPVNDPSDVNSWFFNWGILQPIGNGAYELVETRGNAYMYGDNLICGRISSMTGGSYFDLNNGEMVLGGDSGGLNGALEYKNGKLTIRGMAQQVHDTMRAYGRNYWSKRMMLDWNNTTDGITTFGYDSSLGRSYYEIQEWWLYRDVTGAESYFDVLGGRMNWETGMRYCLKVEWYHATVRESAGLEFGFKYSDGTLGDLIYCAADQTTPVEDYIISAEGKNVVGIWYTFGDVVGTRILNISLTKYAVVPDEWVEADEDIVFGGANLYRGEDVIRNTTSAKKSLMVALSKGERYVVSVRVLATRSGVASVSLFEGTTANGSTTYKRIGRLRKGVLTPAIGIGEGVQVQAGPTLIDERTCVVVGTGGVLYLSGANTQLSGIMVQRGTRSTAYQNSYEYLADSFENAAKSGETNIEGGLLATSLIKLRNASGQVTAGMSGLDDHKKSISDGALVSNARSAGVSMWGGATYAEALAAAAGGSRIPVLLTKLGLGSMIGPFTVKRDRIEVNGTNGTIVIDDDEGIVIYDASGYLKDIITPLTLSAAQSAIQGMTSTVIQYPTNVSGRYYKQTIPYAHEEQSETYQVSTSSIIADGKKMLNIKTVVHFEGADQNVDWTTNFVNMYFDLYLKERDTAEIIHINDDGGRASIYRDGGFMQNMVCEYQSVLSEGIWDMFLNVYINEDDYDENAQTYIDAIDSFQCELCMTDRIVYLDVVDGEDVERRGNQFTTNSFGPKMSGGYTIVASDGILSYYNSNTFFKVVNGANGQKIYAKGLGTSGESGQLIRKTGSYKTFAQNLRIFMEEYFLDISKKSGFSDALYALINSLPDDVYITAV